MSVHKSRLSDTRVKLSLKADQALLDDVRRQVVDRLSRQLRLPGFRTGKVPPALAEKHLDPQLLQSECIDAALNSLYADALRQERLRPVAPPEATVTKFVPFTVLEADLEVDVVGDVRLPDYKKVKLAKPAVKVTARDVTEVLDNLRQRLADKLDVDRAAKTGDQAWIDFAGRDAVSGEPLAGADGHDYPLLLGSNTFIPGFEDQLAGLAAGQTKEFELTFPADYGVASLRKRRVVFDVKLNRVQEVVLPPVDDGLAKRVGPFQTLAELKQDIKRQLLAERTQEAEMEYQSQLVDKLVAKTEVAIPAKLIDDELVAMEQQARRSTVYRGVTWDEYLQTLGTTPDEYGKQQRPEAEKRVRTGLMLSEIADREGIELTRAELDKELAALRKRYHDPAMLAEINSPDSQRELAARILTTKTLNVLTGYAAA